MNKNSSQLAIKVALIYFFVAGAWILFSDQLLGRMAINQGQLMVLSMLKGLLFVVITATALFLLLRRKLCQLESETEERLLIERRYRKLFESMNEGVAYCRMVYAGGQPVDWVYLAVNEQFTVLTGLKDVVGKPVSEVVPELRVSDPEIFEIYGRVVQTGQPEKFERFIHALKTWFAVSVFCPEPGHFVAVFNVLTEQKREQAARRESEERYQALFNRSLDCVFLNDLEGKFLDANQSALNLLGYQREEISSLNFASLLSPNQLPLAFQAISEIVATGQQKHPLEFKLRRKDGGQVQVEIQSSLIFRDGQPYATQGIARDITERKRVEQQMLDAANYVQTLLAASPIAIITYKASGPAVSANEAAARLVGTSIEKLKQQNFRTLDSWKNSKFLEMAQQALDTGCEQIFEGRSVSTYGNDMWLACRFVPFSFADEPHLLFVGQDIGERKLAEASLRSSEEKFEQMAHVISDVFWMKSADFKTMEYVSPGYETVWGRSTASLFANPHQWAEAILPEERERVLRVFASLADARFTADVEYRIARPDGSIRWIHDRGFQVWDAAGKLIRFVGIASDITERKQVEEAHNRLATAVEQSAESIIITDPAGMIQYVNPAFEKTSGYCRAEILGCNTSILKSGQQDADFYRQMWATIAQGNIWRGQFKNRRKDGSLYEEEVTISPVRDGSKKIVNYVAIKRDISREVELQDQVRQSQKMDAIGQLAGGVAHDFNNILAVIQLQAGMLKADPTLNAKQREYARDIEDATNRAADLTKQLLLFSRKQAMRLRYHDLNEVVTSITKMLQRVLGENIQMQFTQRAHSLTVHADSGMLDQVLMNLTVNARDAMPSVGQLFIETSAVVFDEAQAAQLPFARPGAFACLTVRDTGCGMTPEILSRIYEPFFTTKEQGKGTGLGLATVFGIVQQHQGWINVASKIGEGTTFQIYLPRRMAAAENLAEWGALTSVLHGHETMLLVEDDAALRTSAASTLTQQGYHVLAAANGAEALTLWQNHRNEIKLLLTDLLMPGGMNGRELAQKILESNPALKIIYMSGYSANLNGTDLRLDEGNNFLAKPFSMHKLTQIIRDALDEK